MTEQTNGKRPSLSDMNGERPSVTVTNSGITVISYTSKGDCSFSGGNVYNLCIGRFAPSLHIIKGKLGEELDIDIEPGETEEIDLEISIRDGTGLAKLDIDLLAPSEMDVMIGLLHLDSHKIIPF